MFTRLGECGFLGLDKPEEYGGQGGDFLSELILCEELYYGANGGLAMGVGVQVDMAMPPILAFGTEEQKQEWAVPAIAGEKILCLGITEPNAGSDVAAIKTRAVRDGGDWVINGTKTYITNGIRADAIVLVTKTDPDAGYDGFTLFLVPMDTPGVTRSKRLEKLGMHASDTALITFEDVRVPESAVLGEVGKGFHQIMWELQGERLSGCAGNIAAAQRAFDLTLEYVKTRETFGKPLGRHQALRHRVGEMAIKLEAGRELTYATARRMIARRVPGPRGVDGEGVHLPRGQRGRRRVHPVARRRRLHARVRDRAPMARHPAVPDRRRNGRDHARGRGEVVRALTRR